MTSRENGRKYNANDVAKALDAWTPNLQVAKQATLYGTLGCVRELPPESQADIYEMVADIANAMPRKGVNAGPVMAFEWFMRSIIVAARIQRAA